jgi:hypothetical protein
MFQLNPNQHEFLAARRAILRLLQREATVQRAALSVRVRPSFGPDWWAALDDLIRRHIVVEYGEVLKRNGGRTRSVVMYAFHENSDAKGVDFMAMSPADIDLWVVNHTQAEAEEAEALRLEQAASA